METPNSNGYSSANSSRKPPKDAPQRIWGVNEPPFTGYIPVQPLGYQKSASDTALVIDNGSSAVRAGWSTDQAPRLSIPPLMARYKDRKLNRMFMFVGSDVFADGTARGQAKNIYEPGSNIVNNWDVMESVLDYVLAKLGVNGESLDRPVVMTEPLANLGYARKTMTEILFECYHAPSVAFGVDSLFSYNYNNGKNGLVVSSSHSSTHLIPVVNEKPMMSHATRLNWGRWHTADFLSRLLRVKYPSVKITDAQISDLVREHCYVSRDFDGEAKGFIDWTGLEDRDHIVQFPYTEHIVPQKTEEEIARAAEKAKEAGRRLQEQNAKMRLEKLMKKESDFEYYKELQEKLVNTTKKEAKRILDSNNFDDETELEKTLRDLEKSIRKARNKDVGDAEPVDADPPSFLLLDVPDDQLDEESLKQKRQQRLMKSNHDARARAKAEKESEKARVAELERLDNEKRENDLDGWLEERRTLRQNIIQRKKERDRLKSDLGNRKSLVNQMRMKNIANLASDQPTKKRRRGGDEDTFGADDADWAIYRQIATGEQSDDDDEEDPEIRLKKVEEELLQHDPHFTEEHTFEAQSDWTNSILHSFVHGPWPFDPESAREKNQIHLNIERIRVPEVVFQPVVAGLDQAGVGEIACDIFTQRLTDPLVRSNLMKDVFLTGGNALFRGFEERFQEELRSVLKNSMPMRVRKAKDPTMDAWQGAAQWATRSGSRSAFVSREQYMDEGSEYFKEHNLGNAFV